MQTILNSPIFTGTQINYYFVCHRKLWLFSHRLEMEHLSDIVYIGKLIGEESYNRENKEIIIDEKIKIDFVGSNGVIHEIKKSNSVEVAHEFQLLYYIFYLKQKGIKRIIGEINYPKLRQKKRILLTQEREKELKEIFRKMNDIIDNAVPPEIKSKKSICRKCSYFELCYI